MNVTDTLATWAIDSYARNRDQGEGEMKPLLAIIGGDFDALVTPADDPLNDNDVDELAFLIGYVGYACDPVYVTCTWESLCMEREVEHISFNEDQAQDETTRVAIVTWAHCVPTGESVLYMLARHLDDDGLSHWSGLATRDPQELALFPELPEAAHAFDKFEITTTSKTGRQLAMAMLLERNGRTHESLFYEPGTLLRTATEHVEEQA